MLRHLRRLRLESAVKECIIKADRAAEQLDTGKSKNYLEERE